MSKPCPLCGSPVQSARVRLGYELCVDCGESAARTEIDRRKSCVAPSFNKGPYQYVASKQQAKWIGR